MNIDRQKIQLSQKRMHQYAFIALGYKQPESTSIYSYVATALEKNGITKEEGMTDRKFVLSHWQILGGKPKEKIKSIKKPYEPKKTARSYVVRKVTFEVEKREIAPRNYTFLEKMPSDVKITKTKNVASNNFLSTYEWRKLRMEALIKYGRKCVCCGATPESGAIMNVDHIKPRKTHPELALDINNLQILCSDCNHGKGNWDSTDWR